jgi:hypothetical protein
MKQSDLVLKKFYDLRIENPENRPWVLERHDFKDAESYETLTKYKIKDLCLRLKEEGLIEYNGVLGEEIGSGRITNSGIDYIEEKIIS